MLLASVVALVAPEKALKDWKRDATAGPLDVPRITLEAEAEFSILLVLIYWTYSHSAISEPA
jgi:hypothetical protein